MQKARQLPLPDFFTSSLRRLDQVSRLAAASTIPVTKAAMQEKSKKSFKTLAMTASPENPLSSGRGDPRTMANSWRETSEKRMASLGAGAHVKRLAPGDFAAVRHGWFGNAARRCRGEEHVSGAYSTPRVGSDRSTRLAGRCRRRR